MVIEWYVKMFWRSFIIWFKRCLLSIDGFVVRVGCLIYLFFVLVIKSYLMFCR